MGSTFFYHLMRWTQWDRPWKLGIFRHVGGSSC